MASALSRTTSASSRKRLWRAYSRLYGSAASSALGTSRLVYRFADVTISRTMCFTSQPLSMNSHGEPVEQRGVGGGSPCAPRSSSTLLTPLPKNCFQRRFTTVRAVSGFSRLTSQLARSNRLPDPPPAPVRGKKARCGARDSLAGLVEEVAAGENAHRAWLGVLNGDQAAPDAGLVVRLCFLRLGQLFFERRQHSGLRARRA